MKLYIPYALVILFSYVVPSPVYPAETSSFTFGGEISGGARRLAHEAVDLTVTPFQIENGNIFLTLGVAGLASLTYIYDKQIQERITTGNNSSLNKAANAGSVVGDPFLHLGLASLVYGGALLADSSKWKEVGEMMGEALILADSSTYLLKEASGRGRPFASKAKDDFKPFRFKSNYDSFPSMHTSSAFALASVLSATSENLALKMGYYGTAMFVGFSRIYNNKHWTSDVLMGAALGELCGRVVTSYHAGRSQLALAPATYENGAGLALVGTW